MLTLHWFVYMEIKDAVLRRSWLSFRFTWGQGRTWIYTYIWLHVRTNLLTSIIVIIENKGRYIKCYYRKLCWFSEKLQASVSSSESCCRFQTELNVPVSRYALYTFQDLTLFQVLWLHSAISGSWLLPPRYCSCNVVPS